MTQPDSKYVSSSRPVNRRTAVRQPMELDPVNPVVQERLAAKWASQKIKGRFGKPLAEQLRPSTHTAQVMTLSKRFIGGGATAAIAAVLLLLAWIQLSLPLLIAGVLALAIGMALMAFGSRSHALPELAAKPGTPLFDEASLLAFDRAMDHVAADAPEAIAVQLVSLKQQLARIAQQAAYQAVDEHFTMDDRLYLNELLRRYLPDSLQSYLMVPKDKRAAAVLEQGETAVSLLSAQLGLLSEELDKRELKLTKSKAESLLRQQRFLASKSSR